MANIQQAAKWMKEGKKVRRSCFNGKQYFRADEGSFVKYYDENSPWTDMLQIRDLLAEDWEIFEWVN